MTEYNRKCSICGKEFVAKVINKKYCCKECKKKADAILSKQPKEDVSEKVCPVCGSTFTPVKRVQKYCSKECKYKNEYIVAKRNHPKEIVTKVCPACGVSFIPKKSDQIYCSKDCQKRIYWNREDVKARIAERKELNKEEIKRKAKIYNEKTKEIRKVKAKIYRETHKEQIKAHRDSKKDEMKEYYKKYHENNKEYLQEKAKEYYQLHKEEIKIKVKKYGQENKEKIRVRNRKYRERNKEKIRARKKEYSAINRKRENEYRRVKFRTNAKYRLRVTCRSFIHRCLHGKKIGRTQEILGYSTEELKKKLEGYFYENMSWDNMSEWEVHHVKPLDTFDFLNEDGTDNYDAIRDANALTNLYPLFKEDHKKLTALYASEGAYLSLDEIKRFVINKEIIYDER